MEGQPRPPSALLHAAHTVPSPPKPAHLPHALNTRHASTDQAACRVPAVQRRGRHCLRRSGARGTRRTCASAIHHSTCDPAEAQTAVGFGDQHLIATTPPPSCTPTAPTSPSLRHSFRAPPAPARRPRQRVSPYCRFPPAKHRRRVSSAPHTLVTTAHPYHVRDITARFLHTFHSLCSLPPDDTVTHRT